FARASSPLFSEHLSHAHWVPTTIRLGSLPPERCTAKQTWRKKTQTMARGRCLDRGTGDRDTRDAHLASGRPSVRAVRDLARRQGNSKASIVNDEFGLGKPQPAKVD